MIGLLGVGGLGAFAASRRRRRGAAALVPAREDRSAELRELLEQARRARIQGDAPGCVGAIVRLHRALGDGPGELDALLDRVRYGGYSPPQHELDTMLRGLERRLSEHSPQRPAPREGLKLKDG